ncbi:3847_t:CDS:2, partial [Diversispora eburnea]
MGILGTAITYSFLTSSSILLNKIFYITIFIKNQLFTYGKMVGKNYTFDNETIHQFENNIYKYWYWIKDTYPEIGTVASRIFGICANAAS